MTVPTKKYRVWLSAGLILTIEAATSAEASREGVRVAREVYGLRHFLTVTTVERAAIAKAEGR